MPKQTITHRLTSAAFVFSLVVAGYAALDGQDPGTEVDDSNVAGVGPAQGRAYAAGAVTPLLGRTQRPSGGASRSGAPWPVGLRIDRIGVDSQLVSLGLTGGGELEVPAGQYYDYPGWYSLGAAPGERGPAVIAGHLDSATTPSVFHRLGELEPGDVVEIDRADGSVVSFTVDRVDRYSKDNFPTEAVYGQTSDAELRLITCGGGFDRSAVRYRDNVVVFASLN